MTPELFGLLKALAGGSTLALLLMIVIIVQWRENKAKDSCKDPEKAPCSLCRVCVTKRHDDSTKSLLDTQANSIEQLAKAVKAQEEAHKVEVASERTRNDELHAQNTDLLRELLDSLKGTE